jgi:uncharacterized protein
MKKSLLSAFAALLTSCSAQVPQPGDGCVWKVADGDSCLYLSGTIHLLRKEDHPLPPAYARAFADSARLFFELPPGPGRDAELGRLMQEKGALPEGTKLADALPVEVWEELKSWTTKRSLQVADFSSLRPWFVALLVTTTEFQALGADVGRGVEPVFEKQAKAAGKPTAGLETVDFQIGLFAELTEDQQLDLLRQTLGEVQGVEESFKDMISAWRGGDVDALYKLLSSEAEKYPVLMERFLHERNARWVEQLSAELTKPGNAMVLVGAGHLGGPKGVLAGLKARGLTVERVR